MEYLDFELPIKELEEQLDKCQLLVKNQMLMLQILVSKSTKKVN
jgi:acetyl-CoA carboxylase carboxyl transferase subunit alpha